METKYKCLKYWTLYDDGYSIQHVQLRDMFYIMDLRNSQMNVLRQNKPIEEIEQAKYFLYDVEMNKLMGEPKTILFSFFYVNELIGYGGLTNISYENRRAELSFLLDPRRHHRYAADFSAFLSLIKKFAFEDDINLNKIWTETFSFRKHHIEILEANGFSEEGILDQHNYKEPDGFIDSYIHGYLRSDYNGSKK